MIPFIFMPLIIILPKLRNRNTLMQYTSSRTATIYQKNQSELLLSTSQLIFNLKAQSSPRNRIAATILRDKNSPYTNPTGFMTNRSSPIPQANSTVSPMSSNPIIKFSTPHIMLYKKLKATYFSALSSQKSSTPKSIKRSLIRHNTFND